MSGILFIAFLYIVAGDIGVAIAILGIGSGIAAAQVGVFVIIARFAIGASISVMVIISVFVAVVVEATREGHLVADQAKNINASGLDAAASLGSQLPAHLA